MNNKFYIKLSLILLFTISFAFVEASVVIYLRQIYYPGGFHFPLIRHYDLNLTIEIFRELATLILMISISALLRKPARQSPGARLYGQAGGRFWEGFGYFLIIFGVWDIFFYIWLKAVINWPESFFTPDILFLIPVPWIAPVLAPVIVSVVMVVIGFDIVRLYNKGFIIKPLFFHWVLVLVGSAILFFSFMSDTGAGFHEQYPEPYNWVLFVIGNILFIIAYVLLRRRPPRVPY